jgi:hypothetical protein
MEGRVLRKLIALMFCAQICLLTGCAIKSRRNSTARGERLAIEKGKLTETTDPIARTKSYVVISDLLLGFAADAARDQAQDDFHGLLNEYIRAIRAARETIVNAERPSGRQHQGCSALEVALREQMKTLQDLSGKLGSADQEPLNQAIQAASSIREEMLAMLSRSE